MKQLGRSRKDCSLRYRIVLLYCAHHRADLQELDLGFAGGQTPLAQDFARTRGRSEEKFPVLGRYQLLNIQAGTGIGSFF